MTTAVIPEWDKEIRKVARKTAFDWPGVVDEEEMVQDVYLHILESPQTVEDLAEMDSNARYRTLNKIAQRIASQERTDYEYFSGNFRYSVNEVRRLLEDGVLKIPPSDLQSGWSVEEFMTKSAYVDRRFDGAVVLRDFDTAMRELEIRNSAYHEAVAHRYVKGDPVTDTGAGSTRLSRALHTLTKLMNNAHKRSHANRPDGPGTRKALSSRAAHVVSAQQYAGSYDGQS